MEQFLMFFLTFIIVFIIIGLIIGICAGIASLFVFGHPILAILALIATISGIFTAGIYETLAI